MSPILVRPVREQLEHDRIIRLLHGKFRRKYEAGMNPGVEQNVPVPGATAPLFPDLVLLAPDRGRKLQVIVEIETGICGLPNLYVSSPVIAKGAAAFAGVYERTWI